MIARCILALALVALPVAAEPLQPAELPPADYAGLQYVDSQGCMFVRAGTGTQALWIPRVSRKGVPVCGNPPSGQRVPVAEEDGVQPVAVPAARAAAGQEAAGGGYFVEVGNFREPEAATKVEERVAELDYGVVRGRVQGTQISVYAGPFPDSATAEAALKALREAGFPEAQLIGP